MLLKEIGEQLDGKGYRFDHRMDNVKETIRKHLKALLVFIQKRGIVLGILAMLGVGYELAASGRPQEQLNTDQQVTFHQEEAYLQDFLAVFYWKLPNNKLF